MISSERHQLGLRASRTGQETGETCSFLAIAVFGRLSAAMNRLAVSGAFPVLGATAVLAFVVLQLVTSLRPLDPGASDALTFELRDLALGAYRSFDGRNSRLYVVRMPSDEVRAFTVPLRAAKVAMPDARWGQPAFDCTDFGPGVKDGTLRPESVFRCRDADLPAWGLYQWRWSLDGKSVGQLPRTHVDDMPRVKVVRSDTLLHVKGWDIRW
jgi:hypothetical protein